ncbi:MAG: hypothetical protein ACFFCS_16630 [Candidatus Hodarchaeota archaeon]
MINTKIKELWQFAGSVNDEIFMNAQLETAGSQVSRVLAKYEKNIKSAKRNMKAQSYFLVIIIVIFNIIQIVSLATFSATPVTTANLHMVSFSLTITLVIYYVIIFSYIFMLKLPTMGSFMGGESFKFLGTMPLQRKELERIGIIAFLRMNLLEYIALIFTFPIIGAIMTGSIPFFFVNTITNALHVLLSSYLLIIASNFIAKKIMKAGANSKASTIFKIMFFSAYILVVLLYSVGMQYMVRFIEELYGQNFANVETVNTWLGLVFFPFSGAYLSTVVLLPPALITVNQVIMPLIGTGILVLVIYLVSRKGGKILRDLVAARDVKTTKKQRIVTVKEVKVKVEKPLKALLKKTALNMTREIGNIMYFFLPIFMPLIGYFSIIGTGIEADPLPVLFIWFIYLGFLAFFIHFGLSGSEEKVGGLYSSLPIKQLDVYKTRRNLMILNQTISISIALIMYSSQVSQPLYGLLVISLVFPVILVVFLVFLILSSRLLGKLNERYTLMVVVFSKKFLKQVGIGAIMYLIITGELFLIITLWFLTQFLVMIVVFWGINIGLYLMLELIARKMFSGPR